MSILRILPSTKVNQNLLKVVWKEVEEIQKQSFNAYVNDYKNILIVVRIIRKLTLFNSSSLIAI
jgi:hypothetical protein